MLASSDCKHTAHKLAVQEHGHSLRLWKEQEADKVTWKALTHFLINLDADNLIAQGFMDKVKECMETGNLRRTNACLWGKSDNSGTCGKVGMWAEDFARMGGYDQSLLPTGYEDVGSFKRLQ